MTSFNIDDVRDTIGRDITKFLERVEFTAIELDKQCEQVHVGEADEGPASAASFKVISEAGHAIFGTSSLVSAESLSTSARILEELANRGRQEIAHAAAHATRARKIAEALRTGPSEMKAMLALELEHRGEDAQWLAMEWKSRATELLAAAVQVEAAVARATVRPPNGAPSNGAAAVDDGVAEGEVAHAVSSEDGEEQAFSFEDESAIIAVSPGGQNGAGAEPDVEGFTFSEEADSAPANAQDDELLAELHDTFRGEVRDMLVAVRGHFDRLRGSGESLDAARDLERVYHTMKGAAATVGLTEASRAAQRLQQRMQQLVATGAPLGSDVVDSLVDDTVALLGIAGLADAETDLRGPAEPAAAESAAMPVDQRETRATFAAEARSLVLHADELVAAIAAGDETIRNEARTKLAVLAHRVKGSALVAGEDAIAKAAQALEDEAKGAGPSTAKLSQLLAQIGVAIGMGRAATPPPKSEHSPASVRAQDEVRAEFAEEAAHVYEDASQLLARLDRLPADDAETGKTLSTLGRLFHRLKGSAMVLGETDIALHAKSMQQACEGESSVSTQTLADGLARIAVALGLNEKATKAAGKVLRQEIQAPDPEVWKAFVQECSDLLESLDRGILALEETDRPQEHLSELLPTYHTLKGVVNTIGMSPTGKLLHKVEDFIESLGKNPVLPSMRSVANFLLQVQAEVRRNLKQADRGVVEVQLGKFEAQVIKLAVQRRETTDSIVAEKSGSAAAESEGTSAGANEVPEDYAARKFVRVGIDRLDNLMNLAGELVVSRSRLMARVQALRVLQQELGRGSKRILETVERFCSEHEFATMDGRAVPAFTDQRLALAAGAEGLSAAPATGDTAWNAFSELELDRYEDVHVLARSLTEMSSDFGEMHAQLTRGLSVLTDDSDAFGGIVNGIQGEITRSRMVPLEVLFSRLRLPIRDAAHRESKEVRVQTQGEGVHLDKAIADALFQPMLHLVRNAVAHGLESAAGRDLAGKPRVGTIELSARQELGQIVIEVKDDGKGLNLERLRQRGIAMGLISDDTAVDDPVVKSLVFASGLSTESVARDVAGRGVGGELVRKTVERLNGSVYVETEKDRGTRFILTLPLTLAITRALLVTDGSNMFAIPLYFAERILSVAEQDTVESAGVRRVRVDGAFQAVHSLSAMLGAATGQPKGPIVLLRSGSEHMAVQVDKVVGQEEIVVKGLGAVLTGHPLFAGVTIRGTGEMLLIVDVSGLAEARAKAEGTRRQARRAAQAKEEHEEAAPISDKVEIGTRKGSAPRKTRVLFVDDSLSVRKVAEKGLTSLGYDVTVAVDGVDALAKIRDGEFDIVFTDLEMPRMHGFELIRELRFLSAYQHLPVVVVTSRSSQKHREQAKSLGATDYLTKPFTPRLLEAAIQKLVRKQAVVS